MLTDYEPVYAFVRTVPPGTVVTYGQVAACVTDITLTARQVGAAMRYAPPDVPWQRVVGAGGLFPIIKQGPDAYRRQKELLAQEGVLFTTDNADRIDMARCQWHPPGTDSGESSLFDEN